MRLNRNGLLLGGVLLAFMWRECVAEESLKLLHSWGPVCRAVLNDVNNLPNPPGHEIERIKTDFGPARIITRGGLPALEEPRYDFDNDGIEDRIFRLDEAGTYIRGSILFVQKGVAPTKPPLTESVTIADVLVFPCQFDNRIESRLDCPLFSENGDDAGVNLHFPGAKTVFFHGRYIGIGPFRFSGKTYLHLFSNSYATRSLQAVIEPTGGTSYRSVCLFRGRKE